MIAPITLESYEELVTTAAKIQAKKMFPRNSEAQRGYIAGFLNAHLLNLQDVQVLPKDEYAIKHDR